MNYLEGALQGFLWCAYCASLAIFLRIAVLPKVRTPHGQTLIAHIIKTLLLGGALWLGVACVATSLCAVAALEYSWPQAAFALAATGSTFGLAYKLLMDYVNTRD